MTFFVHLFLQNMIVLKPF